MVNNDAQASAPTDYPQPTDGTYSVGAYTGGRYTVKATDWYTDEALSQRYNFTTPVTADITLYGKWKVQPQTDEEFRNLVNVRIAENGGDTADLNFIETSLVKDMSDLFKNKTTFNGDISEWDVSNVTDMNNMFFNASAFNQDIHSWDVSNVTDMSWMFAAAEKFNQDISNWDVSSVTNMSNMFNEAFAFNQDIGNWQVDNVTNMSGMFLNTFAFNQDIGSWRVNNVTNMNHMFFNVDSYNKDLSGWILAPGVTCIHFSNAKVAIWPLAKRPPIPCRP